jgi:tripartite-type tricarboxylate transporter receptor subunit TctC
MKMRLFLGVIFFSFVLIFPHWVSAQKDYPSGPIQVEIGNPPGGGADLLTRGVAKEARKYLGQEILVSYRPGANGTVSLAHVVTVKPDGYYLGSTPSATVTNAPLILDLKFDPFKEIIPIIAYAKYNVILTVRKDSPFKTLKDFLQYAKQNPGKATYGHPGIGTGGHLTMAAIAAQDGIKMNFTPFSGDAPAITALLGGHIMASAGVAAGYVPHVQAGNLRIIASYSEERLEDYPDVPCTAELGYAHPPRLWIFLYGPKGLPEPIVTKLEDAFGKASQSPGFKELTISNTAYLKKILVREELLKNLLAEKAAVASLFEKTGLMKK